MWGGAQMVNSAGCLIRTQLWSATADHTKAKKKDMCGSVTSTKKIRVSR